MVGEQTISEAIGSDHKEIDRYADELKSAKTLEDQVKWRNAFVWRLARHAISEEITMYPAMIDKMGDEGKQLTATDRAQHATVKKDLFKLQSMSPDSADFFPLFEVLLQDLHEHIRHESEEDMPQLEKLLSKAESISLAKEWEKTKVMTPTRSHPSAPDKPPWETLAGLLAAPIDKLEDLIRNFPSNGDMKI